LSSTHPCKSSPNIAGSDELETDNSSAMLELFLQEGQMMIRGFGSVFLIPNKLLVVFALFIF
jgi:hypothetical protein